MIYQLIELLDMIIEKEEKTEKIRNLLGGQGNEGYLCDERDKIYKIIVTALGGNEEHYNFLYRNDVFIAFSEDEKSISEVKEEFIENIVYVIENDLRKGNIAYVREKNSKKGEE